MDLGALELQVFVSLTVILGAAFVALVCDYLKGHNEQLREQNIELRARRDEQERLAVLDPVRWLESFGDRTVQATEQTTHEVLDRWPPPRPVLVAADGVRAEFTPVDKKEARPAVIVPEVVEEPVRFQHRSEPEFDSRWSVPPPPPREILSLEEIQDAIQAGPAARPEFEEKPVPSSRKKSGIDIGDELKQMLKRSFGRGRSPAKPVESMSAEVNEASATEPTPEQETVAAKTSLPERTTESIELLDRIVGRPSQPTPEPVPAVVATESKPSADAIAVTPEVVARVEFSAEPPLNPEPSVSFVPAPPEESATEAVTPIRPLPAPPEPVAEPELETPPAPPVEPLMEALSQNNEAATVAPETTPVPTEAAIPAGFQDAKVLAGLIDSGVQVNGVVFALGITDYKRVQEAQGQQALDELVNAVRVMIVDIVGENDFAARATEDAFVLVFKNESGAAAQRRINQVSERLWDFQLRSLGVSSILFSWGAVEVKEETLKNAIAAANERLEQSRRNRKGSPGSTKRVVNG